MANENELIQKSFYQTMIEDNRQEHPIKTLGEMYKEEMKKEQPDLSSIRYAQGEVYFLNHDYEAAIYKWQHPLDKELIPWAQKNIADAHMEMGLLEYAENFYNEVETDSSTLKSEVLLKLFMVHVKQKEKKKSVQTIKKAVLLNPGYSNVTVRARRYFEEIEDWENAADLAVSEAIRTGEAEWYETLENYVEQGYLSSYEPEYFNEVLSSLIFIDKQRFESFTAALWNSYEQSDYYFQWLEEINMLLLEHNVEQTHSWRKLPKLFKEAYFYLVSGDFLLKEISGLIENHFTNWIELSSSSDTLYSSSAVLAWNEVFPDMLPAPLISEAEQDFKNSKQTQYGREEGTQILDSIKEWAGKQGMLEGLQDYLDSKLEETIVKTASPARIRTLIKNAIEYLLEERIQLENDILQEINWKGELLTDLERRQSELNKLEKDKAEMLTSSFREVKEKLVEKIKIKLPTQLRNCSSLIKEDSDYAKITDELNDEMNKRIALYMKKDVFPDFKENFQIWLDGSESEFEEVQTIYNEISDEINYHFNQEKVLLSADFKVLEDWSRDMDRASRGLMRVENVNILQQNNASQLLWKGAGKLLGSITKNKDMVLNRYKEYVKNADYDEATDEVIKPFIQQLEVFEESIEWDVTRFFMEPQKVLTNLIEELKADIEKQNDKLNRIRENPDAYQDPIKLFEVKLNQYEFTNTIKTVN